MAEVIRMFLFHTRRDVEGMLSYTAVCVKSFRPQQQSKAVVIGSLLPWTVR